MSALLEAERLVDLLVEDARAVGELREIVRLRHLGADADLVFAQLLDRVWGNDADIDERTVDVHVGRLRKSLSRGREADPIRTVRSSGYAFDERFGG